MEISGEYRLKASVESIQQHFMDPDLMKACIPNCIAIERRAKGEFYITAQPFDEQITEPVSYFMNVVPGEKEGHFSISWKGADDRTLIDSGCADVTIAKDGDHCLFSHQSSLKMGNGDKLQDEGQPASIWLVTQIFENIADMLQENHAASKHRVSRSGELVQKTDNAVLELEHEAEEAAARGVLGGAQMWGWIALAIVAMILLVLVR